MLGDLEPWDYGREMFLMCCVCVSCHWGHCHEKTLDNSHDKQKYFDNSRTLDAAEEESSETGAEENPVLSVENSGRDSDVLRLESKLIQPELCLWGKVNFQALHLGFSLLKRLFPSFSSHSFITLQFLDGDAQIARRRAVMWKCSSRFFLFSLPHYLLLEQIWFVYTLLLMSLVYWVSRGGKISCIDANPIKFKDL